MTVSYQSDVASSTSGGLIRLLWRWRGSVWKLVYKELLMFQMAFLLLQLIYNYVLIEPYKDIFKWIVILCSGFVDMIPLSFILGFYVSFIATRWWNQYTAIPWPDKLMNNIAMYIPGNDETSRMLRRTLMRYANLSLILVLRSISIAVKRRFPTRDHLIEAGFMSKTELEIFSSVPSNEFNTFWIPCTWFVSLLREARQDCRITDSCGLKIIMEELNEFRNKCGLLWSYDWVSIPLVYTQVVTLATYCFFIASLFGRQHIEAPYPKVFTDSYQHKGERFVPIFSIIQFLLYMGLLKLGEQLINPFGDDDEDFELNWIIDRHIKVSLLGVDILNQRPPPLTKDTYFGDTDIKLPYTAAAVTYKKKTYRGSMAAYHVPSEQQGLVLPEFEEDYFEEGEPPTLRSSASRGGQSLWSIFGTQKAPKHHSASLLSLDGRSENLSEDWQGSSDSFSIDNQNLNKESTNYNWTYESEQQQEYPKLLSHQFESIDNLPLEEVSELKEPLPIVLKAKGTLAKQSSEQSQESFPNQLANKTVEARKISDTPSYSSSILKNRSSSSSPNRASLFEIQLGNTSSKVLSSIGKVVEQPKKIEKKTNFFKSNKQKDDTKPDGRVDGRPSISSLKKAEAKLKSETKMKTSLFKNKDPKLKIRPFKSKVTFSDEAKPKERLSTASDDHYSDQVKPTYKTKTTKFTIPDRKSTLTIHLDKYDLSASSPELNKTSSNNKQKFPYSIHKLSIDKTESDDRLMNIRMSTGSSHSVVTTKELLNKLPIDAILQLGLPSNQSSQSSDQKLDSNLFSGGDEQRQRSASFTKLGSKETLEIIRQAQHIQRLKSEIPKTFSLKSSTSEVNRRKSFQLQSSQVPIEMHSEYDINFQDNHTSESNDYWLRHRSLPNIQELVEIDSGSEVSPSSPTTKEAANNKLINIELKSEKIRQPISIDSSSDQQQQSIIQLKEHNAQERRSLYSKASKSSSSSNQSSSSLQRKCRKKIPLHLSSNKTNNLKQSSTESDSSYYTAHSVHITIPEMETIGSFFKTQQSDESINSNNNSYSSAIQSTSIQTERNILKNKNNFKNFHTSNESNSSINLSYHSASELFKPSSSSSNLADSTQSLATETSTIPTIKIEIPNSPVTSEQNVFFNQQRYEQLQTDEEQLQERRRLLLEHFNLAKDKNKSRLDTELKKDDDQ